MLRLHKALSYITACSWQLQVSPAATRVCSDSTPLMHKCRLTAASVIAWCSVLMPPAPGASPSALLLCRGLHIISTCSCCPLPFTAWQFPWRPLTPSLMSSAYPRSMWNRSWHFSSWSAALHQHLMHCCLAAMQRPKTISCLPHWLAGKPLLFFPLVY